MLRGRLAPIAMTFVLGVVASACSGAATSAPAATTAASAAPAASTAASAAPAAGDSIQSTDLAAKFDAVPTPKKAYHFAYIAKSLDNEFWLAVQNGLNDAAKTYNVTVDTQAPNNDAAQAEQLNIAQTMLASGKYDAFFVSPQSDANLKPFIDAVVAKGMPVIVINDSRTDGASTYIGTDQVQIGVKAAKWYEEQLAAGSEVALIEGQAGSPNGRNRAKGFTDTINADGKLKLIASQPANWSQVEALNVASNIMQANPNLKGFYAANDQMALGASQAVENAGKLGKVLVAGTDGVSPAKDLIKAGKLDMTVAQFPFIEGQTSIELAIRLLDGEKLPAWIISPQDVITKANIDTFLCQPPASKQSCK